MQEGNSPTTHNRQVTINYMLPISKGHIKVSKKTFIGVLRVTNGRLGRLITKKKLGQLVWKDGRGQNINSHAHKFKYTDNDRKLVIAHVKSFPTEESHYS